MPTFSVPSRESVFKDFITAYALAFPEKNTAKASDPWRLGRVVSGVAWSILAKFIFVLKQILPDTAEKEFLDRWGAIVKLPRKGASPSQGAQALQVTGITGTVVGAGLQLSHQDGTLYVTAGIAGVIDNSLGGFTGIAVVDVASQSTGAAANKRAGDGLTFTGGHAGILADAVLVEDLQGGSELEKDDDYRVRILDVLGDPPEGGALHDYIKWALEVPGVTAAFVWQHRRGRGTIDVAVLGSGTGTGRIIANLTPTQAHIDGLRPGGAADFLVLTTAPTVQDVDIQISVDEIKYGWDWIDDGTGYVVTASNSGAKTITVPTAPASVVAGKRVTVDGEEATVTLRVGNVLTLDFNAAADGTPVNWFSYGSPNGLRVRASGDLVVPVRRAIIALFDELGPVRSKYAQASWDDTLRLAKLLGAATGLAGVTDGLLTTPAVNVSLSDAFGSSVPLLVYGRVRVTRKP